MTTHLLVLEGALGLVDAPLRRRLRLEGAVARLLGLQQLERDAVELLRLGAEALEHRAQLADLARVLRGLGLDERDRRLELHHLLLGRRERGERRRARRLGVGGLGLAPLEVLFERRDLRPSAAAAAAAAAATTAATAAATVAAAAAAAASSSIAGVTGVTGVACHAMSRDVTHASRVCVC